MTLHTCVPGDRAQLVCSLSSGVRIAAVEIPEPIANGHSLVVPGDSVHINIIKYCKGVLSVRDQNTLEGHRLSKE